MNSTTLFSITEYLWLLFLFYWIISATGVKAVKSKENWQQRLQHLVPTIIAFLLLFERRAHFGWLGVRFLPDSRALHVAGVLITGAGVAVAIWARRHLGKNWSAVVSIRAQHELIRSGPYRRIRHPIYTGMLLAMLGTVMVLGEIRGLLAFFLTLFAFYRKARKEEMWLAREFGDTFSAHTKHTGMFLPWFF